MLKKMKQKLNNQKGLTLVELLAVVVILGIIAAIAVPAIGNIIEKQKEEAAKANVLMVYNAARLALTADKDVSKWTDYIEGNGSVIDPWTDTAVGTSSISVQETNGAITVSITFQKGTYSSDDGNTVTEPGSGNSGS